MCNRESFHDVQRQLEVYLAALILVDAGLTNLKNHPAVLGRLAAEDSVPVVRMEDSQESIRYALRRLQTVRALLPHEQTAPAPVRALAEAPR